MSCDGRWATSWQYAGFWCVGSILTGVDNLAGIAKAALTDTTVDFINAGIKPNVGMTVYNLTKDTEGPITAVTKNTITATGVTWDFIDAYRVVELNSAEKAAIELYLDITASDIHAALAATASCDCTLASWAEAYLQKLNIIEAGVFHTCPCAEPSISDQDRATYLTWIDAQLELIRTGKIAVCQGETGSEYPAGGAIELGLTEWNSAQIVINRLRRTF